MTKNLHCPVIHGSLVVNLKKGYLQLENCCLRKDKREYVSGDPFRQLSLQPLREFNKTNQWDKNCWNCESIEATGQQSYRTSTIEKYGFKLDWKGPFRLDIIFDISCNLACRHCGPDLSTMWQKHMKDNKIAIPITSPLKPTDAGTVEEMINCLKMMDLSELEEVVFCGGETMMGTSFWRVAEALAELVPHAKEKLILQFQTNGTIPLNEKHYNLIKKFYLVKFLISIDGTKDQFEYLRWPAEWQQFTENINAMRRDAPVNVMFNLEETVGIFNLFYQDRIDQWVSENFAENRLGDKISHTKHIAMGTFQINHITEEYRQALIGTKEIRYVLPNWYEQPDEIANMIKEIQLYDGTRNEDWRVTFPEVAEFYKRYM